MEDMALVQLQDSTKRVLENSLSIDGHFVLEYL